MLSSSNILARNWVTTGCSMPFHLHAHLIDNIFDLLQYLCTTYLEFLALHIAKCELYTVGKYSFIYEGGGKLGQWRFLNLFG